MIRFLGILFMTSIGLNLSGQSPIKWFTWEEGIAKSKAENKKIIADLYTEWCGWCKKMDATTFHDAFIVDYINKYYVAIKFDAEQKEDIIFKGKEYKFTKGGRRGYHALAAEITNGQLRYPTIVFLDEKAEVIQAIPGFQNVEILEKILTYFAEDYHKSMPWSSYERQYKSRTQINNQPGDSNNHTRLVSGQGN